GSFGISTYIESQSTAIGNTINLAGKNRYLTANLLLQFEKVNDGSAQVDSLRNASDALNENISFLRSGGNVSPSSSSSSSDNIFLTPLSSKYFGKWNEINENRIALNLYVGLLEQRDNTSGASTDNGRTNEPQLTSSSSFTTPTEIFNDMTSIESTASQLIASSDDLTGQLGEDDRMNSQNLVSMQTIFIIAIILVGGIILYVMKRLLQPLDLIIEATKEVRKGNLSIAPIANCNGKDEIGILAASFNSMINQLAEYNRMQKQYISIASHELRTPLQPILGLSDVLRFSVGNNEEARQLADKIFYNAKRLRSIIDNVLEATRIEKQLTSLNKEKVDAYDLLQYVIKDARYQVSTSNKNIRLELFMEDKHNNNGRSDIVEDDLAKAIFVDADRARLTQVFTNLLNNAIKFTTEGVISITLKQQSDSKGVVLLIKDTGTGIPSERFPRLFAKFGTESVTGTGLGLFISKSIVEAHGGTIWGQNNEDGIGATFGFTLPSLSEEERAKTKLARGGVREDIN
ncbi:MAG TPA: HAMP domain-containing sensor histidine kinase, partial [Nitrososphaera sp.]|nr:HAMP domain-containing sensor histidine kinase [Nitrososphaera sp.]